MKVAELQKRALSRRGEPNETQCPEISPFRSPLLASLPLHRTELFGKICLIGSLIMTQPKLLLPSLPATSALSSSSLLCLPQVTMIATTVRVNVPLPELNAVVTAVKPSPGFPCSGLIDLVQSLPLLLCLPTGEARQATKHIFIF